VTAPHPGASVDVFEVAARLEADTAGRLGAWIRAGKEADERARKCREICLTLNARPELMVALVARAASELVTRAAHQRFKDWYKSLGYMHGMCAKRGITLPDPPSCEDASAEIVDTCIRLEREGLLERVIVLPGAPEGDER
jgi:hypothetical protein